MTKKPGRKPSPILMVAAAVLLLLGIYAGLYYAAVRENVWGRLDGLRSSVAGEAEPETLFVRNPYYRPPVFYRNTPVWQERYQILFAPMHWLDRRIRSEKWTTPHAYKDLN